MPTDYGTDFALTFDASGGPDLDPTFRLISGRALLVQALRVRLVTPRGGVAFWPELGEDLRAWLGEAVTPAGLARLTTAVASQCLQDERVRRASATATFDAAARALAVRIAVQDDEGPFELVLAVDQARGVVLEGVT